MNKIPRYTSTEMNYYIEICRKFPEKSMKEIYESELLKGKKCPNPKTLSRWMNRYLKKKKLDEEDTKKETPFQPGTSSQLFVNPTGTSSQSGASGATSDTLAKLEGQINALSTIASAAPNLPIAALLDPWTALSSLFRNA